MSNACYNNLPPLFLLTLFAASYFIYVYYYCFGVVKSIQCRITFLVLVHIFATMFLWSFFATMWTAPGKVPDEYKFNRDQHRALANASSDDERDSILEHFCERKNLLLQTATAIGSIRYCATCMHIKPDRAHHCATCKTCNLKMDHHCPWVNNCIGFRNYKSFMLLLFYTCLYCGYYVSTTIGHLVYSLDISRLREELPLSIGFGLATIMGLITCGFLCYHLYLTCINETTMENVHPPHFVEDNMTFDLGTLQNIIEVFGNRWYLCFLPVFSSVGPGHIFLIGRK